MRKVCLPLELRRVSADVVSRVEYSLRRAVLPSWSRGVGWAGWRLRGTLPLKKNDLRGEVEEGVELGSRDPEKKRGRWLAGTCGWNLFLQATP